MRRRIGCLLLLTCATSALTYQSAGGQVAANVAAPTTAPSERYTFVVAHGATAGGWEWKDVANRLLVDGHTMYRPTYTGLGERAHLATPDVDLNTHITDIVNVIRFEDLHDVVLVGHSYGGMVITGVADRLPDRVRTMVYVDAILPEDGESVESARWSTTNPVTTRPTPRAPSAMTAGQLGQPFRADAKPPYNVVQPPKTFTQPIELTNAEQTKRIPVVYILTVDPGKRAEEDRFYAFAERARRYGWTVWEMPCDHVPSISQPAEMTRLLKEAPAAAKPKTP